MYLVFDVGGTTMRVAGSPDRRVLGDMSAGPTPKKYKQGVAALIEKLRWASGNKPIVRTGGGIAGVVEQKKGLLLASPNLPDWVEKPLKNDLEKGLGCQVVLENDAAVAGLGEATVGAGRRKSIVAYLTVGTGIGGARIVNAKIDARAMGFEPGQQIINVDGQVDYWENFASGTAIFKIHGKRGENIKDPQVWENEARLLAIGVHNTCVMWSPEIVIIGGSVMQSVSFEKLGVLVNEQLKIFTKVPEIVPAQLGEKSGFYGGLILAGGGEF